MVKGKQQNKPTEVMRNERGQLLPGYTANPGGKPRKLVEIENMLDAEHRTVENMREVFTRLKALAMGEVVEVRNDKGVVVDVQLRAHPGFMQLYIRRLLGPESDDAAVEKKAKELLQALLDVAEQARERDSKSVDVKEVK